MIYFLVIFLSHHFMANRRGKMEDITGFIFLNSKVTSDGDCRHEIKIHLLLGRKAMTNLDRVLKSRDIILWIKVCIIKALVFKVVIYGCESWTIKKNEHKRIDVFELWSLRRLLRVPWTASGSNQSILGEINPEFSLEELMLKLKLQHFSHLISADSLEKTLLLEKTDGRRRRGQQRMRWLDSITDSMDMNLINPTRQCRTDEPGWATVHGASESQTWLRAWITKTIFFSLSYEI